jgi:hypothetical protein
MSPFGCAPLLAGGGVLDRNAAGRALSPFLENQFRECRGWRNIFNSDFQKTS